MNSTLASAEVSVCSFNLHNSWVTVKIYNKVGSESVSVYCTVGSLQVSVYSKAGSVSVSVYIKVKLNQIQDCDQVFISGSGSRLDPQIRIGILIRIRISDQGQD